MSKARKITGLFLSLVLVTTLLTNSIFSVNRVNATKAYAPIRQVLLSNGDAIESWGGTNVVLDTTNKIEGTGSIKGVATNQASHDNITIRQLFSAKFDVASMDYLELSLYIENMDQLSGGMGIEISSSGNGDNAGIRWNKEYFIKQITQVGWNHLKLPLSEAVAFKTSDDYNGNAVNWFRFYCLPPKDTNRAANIDNLRATKYDDVPIVLGETGANSNGVVDRSLFTEGFSSIGTSGTTAMGFQIKSPRTLDISGMKTIELDFYTTNPAMFATSNGIELTSSGKADTDEMQWSATHFASQITKVGWNHVVLKISDATVSGNPNLAAINFFRFYSNNSAITSAVTVRIDNMKAVKSNRVTNGTLFSECEDLLGWGGSGAPVVDKAEFLTGTGSVSVTSKGDTTSIQWKMPTAVDVSGHGFFEFDLYTSDLDMFGSDASVELSSGGIHESSEINWSKGYLTAQIKNVGWNHIKLSFDSAGTSSGNTGPFVPENTNWFRFYSVHNKNKEITIKIDNMRVTNNGEGVVELDMSNKTGNLVLDGSGNGNNAVIKGNVGFVDDVEAGTSVKFENGKTGYLEIANPDQKLGKDMAILAKFKPALINATEQLIVGKNLFNLNQRAWQLCMSPDNTLKFYIRNAKNEWVVTTITNDLKLNEWHSVAIVVQGSNINFYLNEKYVTSATIADGGYANTAPIFVGATNDRKADGSDSMRQQFVGEIADVAIYNYALSIKTERYNLWDSNVPLPTKSDFIPLKDIQFSNVALLENYKYQHEAAVVKHNGKLYYSYARNTGRENAVGQIIVCYVSEDDGKTWRYHSQIGETNPNKAWVGGSFLSHEGKLWAFQPVHNGISGGDFLGIKTYAFILNEATGQWEKHPDVEIDNYWANMQPPIKMDNGNWIISGVNTHWKGAVAISDGDDLTKWTAINIPVGSKTYSESTLIVDGSNLLMMMRDEKPEGMSSNTIAVSTSSDYGLTWTEAEKSDMPANTSKPSAGMLSTGQRYLISNSYDGVYNTRENLTLSVGAPGSKVLSKVFLIRNTKVPKNLIPVYGPEDQKIICYPYSIEVDGYLYIAYSSYAAVEGNDGWNQNHMEFAKFPISQLLMPFLEEDELAKIEDTTDKITAIPKVENMTIADKAAVEAARAAFNGLDDSLKDLISADLVQKLIVAESKISELLNQETTDKEMAKAVEDKIAALPEGDSVKISDKSAVEAARSAFSALNDAQKALVPVASVNRLKALEDKIAAMEASALADQAKANEVTALVNALPNISTVKLSDKAAVAAARTAYASLTAEQKALVAVSMTDKLEALEDKIVALETEEPTTTDSTTTTTTTTATTTTTTKNGDTTTTKSDYAQTGENNKVAIFAVLAIGAMITLLIAFRKKSFIK